MSILDVVAKNNNVDVSEVQNEIQFMIDDLWNHPENDTEEFKHLRLVFGRKPTIEEFINYLALLVKSSQSFNN